VSKNARFALPVPLIGAVLAAVLFAGGCSSYTSLRDARVAESVGDWDRAVLEYLELVNSDPADLRFRGGLMRAKLQASVMHFDKGKKYRDAQLLPQAMMELQQAVQLDPTNQYAVTELGKVREEIEARRTGQSRESIAEMKRKKSGELAQPPVLNPRSPEPIDLDFPEPVSLQSIYLALGKAFGINVLFDPKLRDQDLAIQLKDVTAQDALEILMRTAGHFYKTLDERSIIIVADTPQNRRTYEDLIIQTFFLSNSDVKEVMTMLRSLVDSRKIASNEQLNAIILRDTADKVKVAERIIRANDKAKAEVVVDVELLQINSNKMQQIGASLSSYQVGAQLDTGGDDIPLRFTDVQFLNGNNWLLTIPNFMFDFVKTSTDAQTLAKPQLRISEGERARLTIGDRVPVPVTSFNTANTVGSNVVPITSFQYQDVGIRIEIEPRVHHNEEVSLEISIEVSNISGNVGDQPIIGTRNIETSIRLKDGETNFLAGLIRSDETSNDEGIPGLSEIPVIGRFFSRKSTQNQRTDIVLTLTPHIIRRADITEEDLTPIWVGTEQNITFRGGSPRVESEAEGPFDSDDVDSEGNSAEDLRERLEQLPRGLRAPGQDPNAEESERDNTPPSGTELVPSSRPSNPLDRRPPPDLSSLNRPDGPHAGGAFRPESAVGLPAQSSSWLREIMGWGAGLTLGVEELAGRPSPEPPGDLAELTLVRHDQSPVRPGDRFEVALKARGARQLAHLPSTLAFDSERLHYLGARAGDWFASGRAVQVLGHERDPGVLVLGASHLGESSGVSGLGEVVWVEFEAVSSGPAAITLLEAELLDPQLGSSAARVVESTLVLEIRPRLQRPDSSPPDRARPPGR
jgi:general secretion pathway protein D